VQAMLVTGLSPNTGYSVSIQTNGSGKTVALSSGGSATTDSAGLLLLSF